MIFKGRRPRRLVCIALLVALVLVAYLFIDYYKGPVVVAATLVEVVADPVKKDRRQLTIQVISHFPKQPLIPNGVRQFFYLQPELCLVTPTGQDLMVDDLGVACFTEEGAFGKQAKSHEMEKSVFLIPFYLEPSAFNGEQLFLKALKKQSGVWVKIKLTGYLIPPPVESKPVFIHFEPWCKAHAPQCAGIGDLK